MVGKIIGIDYGSKNIGIALSDEYKTVAFPLDVLHSDERAFEYIKELCGKENISAVVVGESLDYNGKPNPIMSDIERFRDFISDELSIPVHMEPEFMTSAQAQRVPNIGEKIDAAAAALILQSYLDRESGSLS